MRKAEKEKMDNQDSDATATPRVQLEHGMVRGNVDRGVCCFKGMPYGASTTGNNRFRPPQPAIPWEGVRDATSFGPDAPQQNPARRAANRQDTAVQTSGIEAEDCLVLNVWTPDLDEQGKRPVMVWLHGGGFISGSGSGTIYNGRNLADRGDLVLVSINHRLGVLGYLNLEGVVESDEPLVNLGMLDILQALEWVQMNIDKFGGDPGQVTLFGESGGGRKVTSLLAMPSAQGLFHRGIIQSGPAIFMNDIDASLEITSMVLHELDAEGLKDRIEQLVGDKAADIIARYGEAFPEASCSDLLALITTGYSRYPIDSITLAERKSARGAASVWLYILTFRTTARRGAMRTPHALEIPFVFDGVEGSRRFVGDGEGPEVMAKQMSSTWIAFARTGDPNNPAIPQWKPYDLNERLTMVFNTASQLVEDFGKVERETFGRLFYGAD